MMYEIAEPLKKPTLESYEEGKERRLLGSVRHVTLAYGKNEPRF